MNGIARWAGDVSNQQRAPEHCTNVSFRGHEAELYGTAVVQPLFFVWCAISTPGILPDYICFAPELVCEY